MCIRKAARMLNLASTSLGPRVTWVFKGGGDVSFFRNFRYPPPQTYFINKTDPRAKPRGNTFRYFYFDTCNEANTHKRLSIKGLKD